MPAQVRRPRRVRAAHSRFVVRLPEWDLADSVLHVAAPLVEALGPTPAIEDIRRVVELVVRCWNAHVLASEVWGVRDRRGLADVRETVAGELRTLGGSDAFDVLSSRWRKSFAFDPRLVASWSIDLVEGRPKMTCTVDLPPGVEAEVPPPAEKRISIGGRFLDEVRIAMGSGSNLLFPVDNHRGVVAADGSATIHAKMPVALQLFSEGVISPRGGNAVDVTVGGKVLGPMVLADLQCAGGLAHDVAVLVFRPAAASGA
jgi:hypothetical protein